MDSATIPGNRNADNIDPQLQQFDHIAFINKTIQTKEVKATSVFSFGFGQKGAQAILVHPKYLFATLEESEYEEYRVKTARRRRVATAEFHRRMAQGKVFIAKDVAPYPAEETGNVLINPEYRVGIGKGG